MGSGASNDGLFHLQDNSSRQTQSGRDLLDVLNNRANSATRTLVTRPVSSRTRVVSSSGSGSSEDGSNGPPMPYSFSYDVVGDETQTYISRCTDLSCVILKHLIILNPKTRRE